MPDDPIATRYAQALFDSAKAQGQLDETLEQLSLIGKLLHEQAPLRQFLHNPDVDPGDKVDLLGRVLQNLHRFLPFSHFEEGPTQRIQVSAVFGILRECPLNQLDRFLQMNAPIGIEKP